MGLSKVILSKLLLSREKHFKNNPPLPHYILMQTFCEFYSLLFFYSSSDEILMPPVFQKVTILSFAEKERRSPQK
jgi:hypothetical protein